MGSKLECIVGLERSGKWGMDGTFVNWFQFNFLTTRDNSLPKNGRYVGLSMTSESLKRSAGSYKLVASKKLAAHPVSSGQVGGNLQTELLNFN